MKKRKFLAVTLALLVVGVLQSNVFAEETDKMHIFTEHLSYELGDVDGDGAITIKDATSILDIYAKNAASIDVSLTKAEKDASDVDGDTYITISDAILVLEYYSKMAANLNPTWSDLGVEIVYNCPDTAEFENSYGKIVNCELMKTYFYDIDQDGTKETISRYEEINHESTYDYTYYRVYENDGSYISYYGLYMGTTGYSVKALLYDRNINEYYMSEVYYHGSNSGVGIEIRDIDNYDNEYAAYHFYRVYDDVYSIAGEISAESEVREYMNNIEIIDIADDYDLNYIRDNVESIKKHIDDKNRTAIDCMNLTLDEFKEVFPDAVYEVNVEGGGPGYYSQSAHIMMYEDGSVVAYAGNITNDIVIGMSYNDIINAVGKPDEVGLDQWSMSEYMVYYIDGYRLALGTFEGSCKVNDSRWVLERASIKPIE